MQCTNPLGIKNPRLLLLLHKQTDRRQVKRMCLRLLARTSLVPHQKGIPLRCQSHSKQISCIYSSSAKRRYFPIIQITSHANIVSFPISKPHPSQVHTETDKGALTHSSAGESESRQFSIAQPNTHTRSKSDLSTNSSTYLIPSVHLCLTVFPPPSTIVASSSFHHPPHAFLIKASSLSMCTQVHDKF